MSSFLPCFFYFSDIFHSFQGTFFYFDFFLLFLNIEKCPLKTVKKVTEMRKTWRKRPHPINVQCITRIYRYEGARMMHYNKNESKIKILKIPIVWVKISKTSILDHIDEAQTEVYIPHMVEVCVFQFSLLSERQPPTKTFQPLLDMLGSCNSAQTLTRTTWIR